VAKTFTGTQDLPETLPSGNEYKNSSKIRLGLCFHVCSQRNQNPVQLIPLPEFDKEKRKRKSTSDLLKTTAGGIG
jgi:hypothetical protein